MSVQTKNDELTPWRKSDNEWFDSHPTRSYRIRAAIPGEPALKRLNGIPLENCWVVVLEVMRRVYSGFVVISKFPPPNDEAVLFSLYQRMKLERSIRGHILIVREG